MVEISIDLIEKYQNPILRFLCERQNRKIKENSKDIDVGISEEKIEPILGEINEGPCKESPISKEILHGIFNSFLKNASIEICKDKKDKYIMSKKAYEAAKINVLELPRPVKKKKTMVIHENIQCRECLMINGYTPTQTKCRYCGTTLHRI